MIKLSTFLCVLLLSTAAHATSITLDPAKGQTLEAWAAKPDKKVTEIHLLPGDHGKPTFAGLSDLTIYGAAGAVVGRTYVIGDKNITFRGNKFSGLKNGDNNWKNSLFFSDGGSSNIHVENSSIAATDDTSKWSDADWLNLPYGQLVYSNASGSTFTNNEMFNAFTIMSINGDDWIVARNRMHDFVNDGMDFRGSNILIKDNQIYDSHDLPTNPMHADGIQGMAALPNMKQPYTNVSIINNHIDAGTKTKSPMQGLSAFDGKWANVIIKGNYVRPRAYHGITWSGVTGIVIDGNTVDQFRDARGNPIVHYPELPQPWINVSSAKDKTPSTDLTIGQNITPRYVGDSIAAMRPRPSPVHSFK